MAEGRALAKGGSSLLECPGARVQGAFRPVLGAYGVEQRGHGHGGDAYDLEAPGQS